MIGLLLRWRYVSAAATASCSVLLVLFGKRVSYEQSIKSFFADDDPDMAAYQKAATVVRRRQLRLRRLRRPRAAHPRRDGPRRRAGRGGRARRGSTGVLRVESLDAMPLLWAIDDALLALDRLPAFARNLALDAAKRSGQEPRPEDQRDDGRRGGPGRGGDAAALAGAQGAADAASAVPRAR